MALWCFISMESGDLSRSAAEGFKEKGRHIFRRNQRIFQGRDLSRRQGLSVEVSLVIQKGRYPQKEPKELFLFTEATQKRSSARPIAKSGVKHDQYIPHTGTHTHVYIRRRRPLLTCFSYSVCVTGKKSQGLKNN